MAAYDDYLTRITRAALIALLAAMAIIIFANVVLRYATSHSIEWAEEVARYLMVWLTFIGAGPVLRAGGHIAIENLQDSLPAAAAQWLRSLVAALLLIFFVFMVVWGVLYVQRVWQQVTPTTQISMGWVYAAMPVGGLLLIANLASLLRGYVRERQFAEDHGFDANASASL